MRDYKTTFREPRKSKLYLFRIPILATLIIGTAFYWFSGEQTATQTQTTSVLSQPLQLPGHDTPLPDSFVITKPADKTAASKQPGPQEPVKTDPSKTAEQVQRKTIPEMSATWESHKIKSGDTLAEIFKDWKLSSSLLHKIVNSSKQAKSLADIRPGETIKLLRDDNGDLLELAVVRSPTETFLVSRNEDSFDSETITREVEVRQAYTAGIIENSLFLDGQKAGLTDSQIMEMAGIFGWDIDFALELRKGDSFKLLYEEHYLDGEKYRNGPILAAEFINKGTTYKAVRYTTPDDDTSYYDPDDGRNKKRAFIRTPVKFARISSGFTRKRWHPVLKKWRSHKGVDYAAPTGTPVKSTGNGVISFRGKKGGYGNVIFIKHGGTYTTVYGHLSRFAKGMRNGKKVRQGQLIGYVGSTGLATGPHLHYEFRVNGSHRNPLTVKLPKAEPISKKYRNDFDQSSKQIMAQFNLYDRQATDQLAQLNDDKADG